MEQQEADEEAEEVADEEAEAAISRALATLRQSPTCRPFLASQQHGVKPDHHPPARERPALLSKSKGWSSIRESFSLPAAPPARQRSHRRRSHQRRLAFEEAGGQGDVQTKRNSSIVEDKGWTRSSPSKFLHSSIARQTDVLGEGLANERPIIPARPVKFEGKGGPRGEKIEASDIERSKPGKELAEIVINLMASQGLNVVDKVV